MSACRDNQIFISTGAVEYTAQIHFSTFGDIGDANIWSTVHHEGVQILADIWWRAPKSTA